MSTSSYTNWLNTAAESCGGFFGKRVLDVGCDFFGTVVTELCSRYGASEAVGLNAAFSAVQALSASCRLEAGDIRQTNYPDAYFDVILSVSAFEHIHNLDVALQEMHRILKPGGFLFTCFGPIWSTSYGHHLWLSYQGETYNYWNVLLPPYAHLLMQESEIFAWCRERFDPELSQAIAHYILHSSDQNQLFFEDYETIVQQSPFQIHFFRGYQHPELTNLYQPQISPDLFEQLRQKFPNNQNFEADGIEMLLQREPAISTEEKQISTKILFFAPYGEWLVHHQVDAVLALSLQQRGSQVFVIGCDGLYPLCAVTARDDEPQKIARCQDCSSSGQTFFQSYGLPYIQLRQFITPSDYEIATNWVNTLDPADYANAYFQQLPIGQWVTSTINTYFRISSPQEFSRAGVRQVHQQYLIDGFVTYKAIGRLLDAEQPDRVVIFNGRFAPYRIALETARQRNLEVLVHERGFVDDSFIFFENTNCLSIQPVHQLVSAWQNLPLRLPGLQQCQQYFLSREQGKNLNWSAFYNFQTDYAVVRQKLAIPSDARIFAIFTSSADELVTAEDYTGMSQQLELVERLMEIFADREEYLVVRHHPWIGGNAHHPATTDFLTNAYQQAQRASARVRIVMPNEQLTSYALLWHTDAAIAFFSTIALEAAARGVAIANIAGSRYSPALEHTISAMDQDTLQTLVETLLSPKSELEQVNNLRQLYRFTYNYFFRFSKKFRSFGIKNLYSADLRFSQVKELQPGCDPELDRVCDYLLQGAPLHALPEQTFSPEEEEEMFLRSTLAEITATRQQVREQSRQTSFPSFLPTIAVIRLEYNGDDSPVGNLSAWLTQSRYSQVTQYLCSNLIWDDYRSTIQTLLKTIACQSGKYILVTTPYFQYDEAFLSTAVDRLQTETELLGVLAGAWLAFPKQGIHGSIFTPAVSSPTYRDAVQVLPLLQHPLSLLGFAVLKREALIQLLEKLQTQTTLAEAAEYSFNWLTSSQIYQLHLPMMLLQITQQQQLRGLELEYSRLTTQLDQAEQKLQQIRHEALLARDQLQHTQVALHQSEQQIQALQKQLGQTRQQTQTQRRTLKQTRTQLKQLRQAFDQSEATIEAMKTSKFWKLRASWVRLKRSIGLRG